MTRNHSTLIEGRVSTTAEFSHQLSENFKLILIVGGGIWTHEPPGQLYGPVSWLLSGRQVVVGILGTTTKTTQLATKDAPGDDVDVEVAGVVRQSHLLDQRADVVVDEVATPRLVGGVVGDAVIALGEAECQRVADGDRQSGDDEVE